LYNILIEFGVPMKLVRPIKICLNETYSKVRIRTHVSSNKVYDRLAVLGLLGLCLLRVQV
jgi:hypothetical protein